MWEIIFLITIAVICALPPLAYFCIKLGTVGFFKGKQFSKRFEEKEEETENQ